MIKQANIVKASIIVTTATLAIMGVVTSMSGHNIDAQMMGDHGGFGNMTSGLHEPHQKMMINGTINVNQTIFDAIASKVNTSLTKSMTTAEQSVGNKSFALAAFGDEQGGYFTYRIILGTSGMKFYNVWVDPGNGKVLAKQEVSQNELEMMHQEHSAKMVQSGGGSGLGFPFLIPH